LIEEVEFDDALQDYADKKSIFKRYTDLKYYLLTFAFVGLGAIIIYKYDK
jgi:hypothetical protein